MHSGARSLTAIPPAPGSRACPKQRAARRSRPRHPSGGASRGSCHRIWRAACKTRHMSVYRSQVSSTSRRASEREIKMARVELVLSYPNGEKREVLALPKSSIVSTTTFVYGNPLTFACDCKGFILCGLGTRIRLTPGKARTFEHVGVPVTAVLCT